MKKITYSAFQRLSTKKKGRTASHHPIVVAISNLQVGEALTFTRDEWGRKNSPANSVYPLARKLGVKFATASLADGSGWAVGRKA